MSLKNQFAAWKKAPLGSVGSLGTPLGALLFIGAGLLIGAAIPLLGLSASMALVAVVIGLPALLACMFYHQFGIALTLIVAFLVQFLSKYTAAPVGTSLDGLLLLMMCGILVSQIVRHHWAFAKHPISTWLLIWIYYNIFQVLNPSAESKMAWLYTVRSLAVLNLLYFIACYAFTSLERIRQILHLIIILAVLTAVYGLKQEFFGFSNAEQTWLYADPERFQLFFQWGRMRVFSLLSDAMTFGIMMAYMGLFCFIYATAPLKMSMRIALIVAGLLMFWSSAYSGTRTAYVLIPLGIVFYVLMTLSKRILIIGGLFTVLGVVVLSQSTANPVLYRIQSAFKPSEDASVQIRYFNQQRIRPYIYSHPIGFGPGSTGLWARRFTPNSFLAGFAHDSYYVRLAVEEGWIGLIVYMIFLFVVLRSALVHYLHSRNPLIRTLYLAILTALFMLAVANYPQEAIVQLPTSLITYVFFAAIVKLKDFDTVSETAGAVSEEVVG